MGAASSPETQCAGISSTTGNQCRNAREPDSDYCHWHLRKLIGTGRPVKGGKDSSSMNPLRETINSIVEAVDLRDLEPDIATFEARREQLEKRVQEADSPKFRIKALKLWEKANDAEDIKTEARWNRELGELLLVGVDDDAAWRELLSVVKDRFETSKGASELDIKREQLLTLRQVRAMCLAVIHSINEVNRSTLGHGEAEALARRYDERVFVPIIEKDGVPARD